MQTNRHIEAKRHTVTKFHYKYGGKKRKKVRKKERKKNLSWKCYQALFSVVEQMKPIPNLPNKCSRENYSQSANLSNIK